MDKWKGKIAVVTGASSGIGEAITIKLVEAGMIVAGFARRSEKVDALSRRLGSKSGKLYSVRCDITNEEEVKKNFNWVYEKLGPVNVLVNNAGIARPTTLINGDINEWRKVVDTNLTGLCICTKEAIKQIRAKPEEVPGHIFHINSVLGHQVSPLIPQANVYPATKYAVTALAETLRIELNDVQSKIKITSISPGLVRTEIATVNGFVFDQTIQDQLKEAPILDPEDVADAVIYALSTKPHVLVQELIIRPVGEKL